MMSAIDSKRLRLLLKDAAQGFYQQMYFLGKDVIHPAGNQDIESLVLAQHCTLCVL